MSQVFISAKLPTLGTQLLDQAGIDYTVYSSGLITKAELMQQIKTSTVLICPLSTVVDQAVIDAAPQLKLIANFGAGFNNIDSTYAKQKGIAVTNTPLVSTNATAELTAGLIIALSRRIVEGNHLMHHGGFDGWAPLFFLGNELKGQTLGIFGMGQIGQSVAEKMRAFGMNIIYTQRKPLSPKLEKTLQARFVSKETLLQEADILSLHAPLTSETTHTLTINEFSKMKPTALVINAARGALIKESDLVTALTKHLIAGAALDVYEFEPQVTEQLKDFKQVILTPHIGNASIQARDQMATIVAKNAIAVLSQQPLQYIVNA